MRTSKLILDSVSEHDTTKAQSRRNTGHATAPSCSLDHCPIPTTYWYDYPPMESLHGRAQPRQNARNRA